MLIRKAVVTTDDLLKERLQENPEGAARSLCKCSSVKPSPRARSGSEHSRQVSAGCEAVQMDPVGTASRKARENLRVEKKLKTITFKLS